MGLVTVLSPTRLRVATSVMPFSLATLGRAFGRPSRPPHGALALDPPAAATIDPHEGAGGSALRSARRSHQPLNCSTGVEFCIVASRLRMIVMPSCASAIYRLLDAEQHALSNRGEEGGHAGRRRPAWPVARVWRGDARSSCGDVQECARRFSRVRERKEARVSVGDARKTPRPTGMHRRPPSRGDAPKPDRGCTETL